MQIGRYKVPGIRLYPTLVEATKLIYQKFGSDEITDMETLARLLGHKTANSGAFLVKLACFKDYGLLEGRGKVRVTEVGKRLTFPSNEEEGVEALGKAIDSIPLWRELRRRFPTGLPESFWVDLAKIAGLEAPQAQALEGQVKREFMEDTKHLAEKRAAIPPAVSPPTPPGAPPPEGTLAKLPEGLEELKWGDIRVWLPKGDTRAAQRAKSLIELYIKEHQPETEKNSKSETNK